MIVTDSLNSKLNVGDEYDPANARSILAATGALLTRTSTYANQFLFGANVENDRQLQITSDPVVGNALTYTYFRAFASDPALFQQCDKDPPFPVYLKRKCGKRWYFIPLESGRVFQQLVLKTSLMLGPETPPPVFWPTRISTMTEHQVPGSNPPQYEYDIQFDPAVNVLSGGELIVNDIPGLSGVQVFELYVTQDFSTYQLKPAVRLPSLKNFHSEDRTIRRIQTGPKIHRNPNSSRRLSIDSTTSGSLKSVIRGFDPSGQ